MNCLASLRTRALSVAGRFVADESGATAIEYGLMTALIGLALIGTLMAVGDGIRTTLYERLANALAGGT